MKMMAARETRSEDENERVFRLMREQLRGLDDVQQFEILFPIAVKAQHHAPSWPAAKLLRELSPACPLSCEDAIKALFPEWDISIEEVPFYIASRFGVARVRQAIERLDRDAAADLDRRIFQTLAYWMDMYEQCYRTDT
jgi:hypothetical protein